MKVAIFNIRLSKEIVEWLDYMVSKGVYKSRAEAIREFSRDSVCDKGDLFE
ncbi:MAG: ribbon-helix-helix domain-containing protein [Nanoarchaeota archaeon]